MGFPRRGSGRKRGVRIFVLRGVHRTPLEPIAAIFGYMGHFWKTEAGRFWQAPKQCVKVAISSPQCAVGANPVNGGAAGKRARRTNEPEKSLTAWPKWT